VQLTVENVKMKEDNISFTVHANGDLQKTNLLRPSTRHQGGQ